MNKKMSITALALAVGAGAGAAQAQSLEERVSALENTPMANTNFAVGGFVKADSHLTQATDGDSSATQEFLIPSLIPTGGDNSSVNYNNNAKQSRIFFKTTSDTEMGDVGTYIEIDFRGAGGDERVSSSYGVRLRHAFMTFQDFTIGQTWSTFFNVGTLPENLDFVGPVGTIFERQAQIRYSPGNWDFALENPQSTFYNSSDAITRSEADATVDDLGGTASYDSNRMPDLVARYNVPVDAGSLSIAAMGREIAYKNGFVNPDGDTRESAYGYGVSLAAKMPVGDNGSDIRAQLNGGNAMGRYLSLNGFRAAQIEDNGDIELIDQMGGFVSYRHIWSPQWRSNLTLSHSTADNPDSVAGGAAKSYSSTHANLIYSPISNLDLGGEIIWGDKELENGSNGELHRLQFTAKLGF
ncbi:porin-like protein [Halospina denitrificans]|uniref:Porin-like protein n=1 Tax=Halospina denitrificans TaxID=332522 RepID=A0A4R7JPB9_9GAMM|nr:DcaP family trimeric outer membrane transporter [Halospina denitrificans]TDT38609.1 porin-like protein [Halospina denitrificans]